MSLPTTFPKVSKDQPAKILAVCLGNICRSPTLDIVLRTFAAKRGLNLVVDSCGTANYHEGEPPHPPSIKHAKARGYDMSKLVARQLDPKTDFTTFDLILCADKSNYQNVMRLCPKTQAHKVMMATDWLPENTKFKGLDYVPDPWGCQSKDFVQVIDMSEEIMGHLCDVIEKHSQ